MIDITQAKDPERVLRNAVDPLNNPPGTRIIYHTGETTWQIQRIPVAAEAYKLWEDRRVHLMQEIVSDSPRVYNYIAEVR